MSSVNPVIVALDVDSPAKALALADTLRGAVAAVKVGSQLFTAAGPDIVRRLTEAGHRVWHWSYRRLGDGLRRSRFKQANHVIPIGPER